MEIVKPISTFRNSQEINVYSGDRMIKATRPISIDYFRGLYRMSVFIRVFHIGCIKKVDPFKFKLDINYCIKLKNLIASN